MSDDNKVSIQIGPGAATTLTIIFVLLKVFGKIDWSWWWVFSPIWISFALVILFFLALVLFAIWANG